jgi:hypothetical protein
MKVFDALAVTTRAEKLQTLDTSTGEETMFKVVPAPDDPTMFVVQSDAMPREEAEKQAKVHNAMEAEGEEEGEGEKKGAMPPFKEAPPAAPPFAMRAPAGPGGPGGPGGMGARPPMPIPPMGMG